MSENQQKLESLLLYIKTRKTLEKYYYMIQESNDNQQCKETLINQLLDLDDMINQLKTQTAIKITSTN